MSTPISIADRLLAAVPSATYCLPALLELSEVVETTRVPTAAVECRAHPRLLINPDWVERHAQTPEKLLMLVMHELHHVILGHTRLYPRATPLDNLVFDAVINSMLCRAFPGRSTLALLTDFYDDAKFPECFLRPPLGWSPSAAPSTPPALRAPELRELAQLYQRLYTERGASYSELRVALSASVDDSWAGLDNLLGDHRPEAESSSSPGALEHQSPELLAHLSQLVEQWPTAAGTGVELARDQFLAATRVVVKPPTQRTLLAGLLRRVAHRAGRGDVRCPVRREVEVEGPIPHTDRRTLVLTQMGLQPLLYRNELAAPRVDNGRERVHVYLDVSGSMKGLIGDLYGAVLDCQHLVHQLIHVFSTAVADVTLPQLKAGRCPTTGGNTVECVTRHMVANHVRHAVMVTDGYIGSMSPQDRAVLSATRLGVALWGTNPSGAGFQGLVNPELIVDMKGGTNGQ